MAGSNAWDESRRAGIPGTDYVEAELGRVSRLTESSVAAALALVTRGTVYDLDSGRWPGMPLFAGHPAFQVSRYRTAQGMDVQHDLDGWLGTNEVHMGFTTELMTGTMHTGTHLDALAHTTCGEDNAWYGGFTSKEHLGDFGPLRADATTIAPFVTRGVLVDLTAETGGRPLAAGTVVGLEQFQRVAQSQGVELRAGDSVLVNTGYLTLWNDGPEVVAAHKGAGIGVDVAEYLAEVGVVLVGSDTETVEADPSPDPHNPHPVHIMLMVQNGIHLLELAHLADLARDGVHEFAFICLPLRVRGGTGSMVRPIAVV